MPTFHKNITSHATRATVYQLRADVLCRESMESAFSQVIDLILPFVAKSLYAKLPPEAAEHHSFEISDEDRLCECVAVPERMLWRSALNLPARMRRCGITTSLWSGKMTGCCSG